MAADAPLESGGWRISTGFAATKSPRESRNFYAVYAGDAFGHAERGVIAVMARGHPEHQEHGAGARDSAQLVVHSLAEGYFGAQRTLSSRRATSVALTAINRWQFGATRVDNLRHLTPVSVTSLMFHDGEVGMAQIGAGMMYRYRNKKWTPLLADHVNNLPDGQVAPRRAVGLDLEISVDYVAETAAADDRYIFVSGCAAQDQVYAILAQQPAHPDAPTLLAALGQMPGTDKAVMVLDILAAPLPGQAEGSMSDLPLRPAPREGDVWDGFAIGKTLYHGRYTILKAAHDSVNNREVALKIPLPSMLQDEVFAAGFMREAWIGTTVRGENIARYIDLPPERRSSLYLVMPLYRGETLEKRLHRAPPVGLPDGIGIALQLCEAAQDLGAIQIIHRDIKPDNIMLLEGGGLRLLDLGLAYLPGIDVQDAVKPGGTLRYMAPELLNGVQANARSEVFALGVTLYRMFAAGAFPFGQREAVPLARLRPDLPGWLGRILEKSLTQDSAARFADAGAMAAALQEGLVSGVDAPGGKPAWHMPQIRVWQILTGVFASGFIILLCLALR